MSTVVVGLRPATRNAGICVLLDGEVVEAVTVEGPLAVPKPETDPATGKALPGNPVALVDTEVLVALAADTVAMVREMLADLPAGSPRPLYVVEGIVPGKRAGVARGRVLEAVIAQAVNQGALVSLLTAAGEDVQVVPSDDFDKRDPETYPEPLRGPKPPSWRGRKGSDRSQQQAAYLITLAGVAARGGATTPTVSVTPAAPVAPVTPVPPVIRPGLPVTPPVPSGGQAPTTPAEFVAALTQTIRTGVTADASVSDIYVAAQTALTQIRRPAGVPDLTPLQVAKYAIQRAGVAPHLNTPDHLVALQEVATR